jgi:hypothetical protein
VPERRPNVPTNEKGGNTMAGNKVTIRLTEDQQSQIKNATGRSITELNIDVAATGQLSDKDLDQAAGGVIIEFGKI